MLTIGLLFWMVIGSCSARVVTVKFIHNPYKSNAVTYRGEPVKDRMAATSCRYDIGKKVKLPKELQRATGWQYVKLVEPIPPRQVRLISRHRAYSNVIFVEVHFHKYRQRNAARNFCKIAEKYGKIYRVSIN